MRAVRLFRDRREYERFVFDELIAEPARQLLGLLQFRARARDLHYYNPTLRAMYFLDDFAHMLFYYPHDMASVSPREFEEAVILSEYAASNETEILAHYRVPELDLAELAAPVQKGAGRDRRPLERDPQPRLRGQRQQS